MSALFLNQKTPNEIAKSLADKIKENRKKLKISQEALAQDDSRICKSLWKLIDEADIVVAYNGKKADIPWMNTRFIVHSMNPPKPYFIIDPCEVAKKKLLFKLIF